MMGAKLYGNCGFEKGTIKVEIRARIVAKIACYGFRKHGPDSSISAYSLVSILLLLGE
jgi:hypothetical protein